jgi:hypothetical protein
MEGGYMRLLSRLIEPKTIVHAHCDLPLLAKIEEISKIFGETKQG